MVGAKVFNSSPVLRRLNSIFLQFTGTRVKPSYLDVVSFLKCNFKRTDITGFYYDDSWKNYVVKLDDTANIEFYLKKTLQHTLTEGEQCEVTIARAKDFLHCVKLVNVPFEVTNTMIYDALRVYGEVVNITYEYAGTDLWRLPNGNRIAHMQIDSSLPLKINVAGLVVKVNCTSLARVCFSCGQSGHEIANCDSSFKSIHTLVDEASSSTLNENSTTNLQSESSKDSTFDQRPSEDKQLKVDISSEMIEVDVEYQKLDAINNDTLKKQPKK